MLRLVMECDGLFAVWGGSAISSEFHFKVLSCFLKLGDTYTLENTTGWFSPDFDELHIEDHKGFHIKEFLAE